MRLKELVQDGKCIGNVEQKTLPKRGGTVDIMIRRRINIAFLQET